MQLHICFSAETQLNKGRVSQVLRSTALNFEQERSAFLLLSYSRMLKSSFFTGYSVLRQCVRTVAQLRGRPYLPGSNSPHCPELLAGPRSTLPFTVKASDVGVTAKATAAECAAACKENFESTLLKYGAILYRGFPLNGPEDFAAFYGGLGKFKAMDYVGGAAPRQQVPCTFYKKKQKKTHIK